jgi:hypothetical protein
MKYKEIEDIFSAKRMQKYVLACGGDTRRAMTLYRDTSYVLNQYARMMKLFQWMNIDGPSLVYGLDHVAYVSGKVMCI